MEPNPTPTLVLYGPEDHVIPSTFPRAAEVAFPNRMGPFVVPGAGHFLQWERAELLERCACAISARTCSRAVSVSHAPPPPSIRIS